MRRATISLAAAMAAALTCGTWLAAGPASAATTKERGVAGYHFSVAKGTKSLTLRGKIRVPKPHCSSKATTLAPLVTAGYLVGTAERSASVVLVVECVGGVPVYRNAVLEVGAKDKVIQHSLKPGDVVTATVKITKSSSSVKIEYSNKKTDSLKGAGGKPAVGVFAVSLANPPTYSPVDFSACTVNGKKLSSLKPGAWESVTKSGKVNGIASKIHEGTSFAVRF